MKRNAKINSRKLSLICLVLTLVIAMTAIFVVTASAADETVKITFDDLTKMTASSSTQQTWEENGIQIIYEKGSSSNFAEYAKPARFYAGTKLTVKSPTGTKIAAIEFDCNNATYATAMKNSIGSSATVSNDMVTITLDGTSDTFTVDKLTGQVRMDALTITLAAGSQACTHPNKTTTTTPADCTTDGSTKVVCDDCGTTISNTSIPAPGHNYVDGTCSECGEEEPAGYVKVTDVTTLKVGDKIVIVATAVDKALSNTQGTSSNNRGTAAVVKNGDVVTFGDDVQIIELEAGSTSGTFAFNIGSGYLSAASSSSNNTKIATAIDGNSSWKITISGGVATLTSQGSYTRNTFFFNKSSNIFSCYASTSGMADKTLSIYKMPAAEPEVPVECPHTNQTTTTNPAKCESDGSTVVTCDDCGTEISRTPIPATGHVNTTKTTVDSTCTTNGSVTVTCDDCGKTVSTETLEKAAHDYDDNGVCGVCGFDKNDKGFSGNYAIFAIRSSGNYYAMSSDLGDATTKRYQAVDSGATELPECIYSDHVSSDEHNLIFALEKNEDGTYYLYAVYMESNNYLGWSSGNSGALVAKENAKKLTVEKNDDGTFNIYFNDGTENRYLSLNGTANNDYFAWYAGTQRQDLKLIPIVEGQAPTDPENPDGGEPDLPGGDVGEPECYHEPRFVGANVNIGDSLTLKVFLDICEHDDISKYNMVFTMNERTVTVAAIDEAPAGHLFVLDGITPQCMGDSIRIQVTKDGAVLDGMTVSNYSIKTNLVALLEDYPDDEKLHQLVYDTLAYGAAAQKYCGYKTNALVNAGYEALASNYEQPADTHTLSALANGATASFKSAAVEFGDYNTILIKINATDVTNVKLMFGEVELELGYEGNDVYYAFTDAISALNLKSSYTFTLYENGTAVQTLSYSVNDYASRKWNDAEMGELVKALYAYGVSAFEYYKPEHKD